MALKEVYTPVVRHFSDGCNTEIFWAKHTLLIISYVFGEGPSYGFSCHYGKSVYPLRVKLLKHKTGYLIFVITAT